MFDHINLALYRLSTASDIIGNGAKAACPVDAAGKSECGVANVNGLFTSVTSILLFIVGAISVIMIIVGALRYVLSAGDGKNTAAAKDTILYAIVGLVIALSAYAIITFVTGHVK
jgi:hypothetical protein